MASAFKMAREVNFVYDELLIFFPQLDPRILKAVAIENPTNIDLAFCVVMDEILPYVPGLPAIYQKDPTFKPKTKAGAGIGERLVIKKADVIPPSHSLVASNSAGMSCASVPELKAQKNSDEFSKITNTEELISFAKGLAKDLNIVTEKINDVKLTSLYDAGVKDNGCSNSYERVGYSAHMSEGMNILSLSGNIVEPTELQVPHNDEGSVEALALDCVGDQAVESGEATSEDEQANPLTDWFDVGAAPAHGVAGLHSEFEKLSLLEGKIEDAKYNKKTLFSSMELVMNLMREVENKEKTAEKVKEEASTGGLEILAKAEELKTMLGKAKEANDMVVIKHAGEIYGERTILATEVKDLQSRLNSLTKERDEALCMLDEMRSSLEMRLNVADEEIRKSGEEKLTLENSAKKYLDEQEAIMNKIVEESKFLRHEAEENVKLREFLVERGHTVDTLQGEISVICKDVKSLKHKYDDRVPLSESVSSDQTTCLLASSSSSKRSNTSTVVSDDQEAPFEPTSPSKSPKELRGFEWELVA